MNDSKDMPPERPAYSSKKLFSLARLAAPDLMQSKSPAFIKQSGAIFLTRCDTR